MGKKSETAEGPRRAYFSPRADNRGLLETTTIKRNVSVPVGGGGVLSFFSFELTVDYCHATRHARQRNEGGERASATVALIDTQQGKTIAESRAYTRRGLYRAAPLTAEQG